MTRITLEPASLLSAIPSLLPNGSQIQSQQEAYAVLIHAISTTLGLQLVAGDDADATRQTSNVLHAQWNSRAPDFTLKYDYSESEETVVLKIVKLGNRTLLHGAAEKSGRDASLDVTTSDYVSPSFFPSSEPLVHGFVSADRLSEFTSKFINTVIKAILPDIEVDIAANPPAEEGAPPRSVGVPPRARQEEPRVSPLLDNQNQPYAAGRRNPLEIGREDLDPFPNPFAPPPLFGGDRGGGMFVGPNHPIFGGRQGPGGAGPWGGDGFLPPMGAPPGARFDPVGPFGRQGFPGVGRGGAPRRGPFGGDPDNDEFLPPGNFGPNQGGPGGSMYM